MTRRYLRARAERRLGGRGAFVRAVAELAGVSPQRVRDVVAPLPRARGWRWDRWRRVVRAREALEGEGQLKLFDPEPQP